MDRIGVKSEGNAILMPYKSLSCLIGIRPEFKEKTVGSPCDVCSEKDEFLQCLDFFSQKWDEMLQVRDHQNIRHLAYGCILVGIDGHHKLGFLHPG